jgi:hypothetical protein
VIFLAVAALLLVLATHHSSSSTTETQAAPAPAGLSEPEAGQSVSCLNGHCVQGGREVNFWFQGDACGEGRRWTSNETEASGAAVWRCQPE